MPKKVLQQKELQNSDIFLSKMCGVTPSHKNSGKVSERKLAISSLWDHSISVLLETSHNSLEAECVIMVYCRDFDLRYRFLNYLKKLRTRTTQFCF